MVSSDNVDEPFRAILLHSPGASPGLGIGTHLLSPKGAALPRRKANARVVVPFLRSSYFLSACIPKVSYRALPSFHPGLCRSVVPMALIMRLNFDALALPPDEV